MYIDYEKIGQLLGFGSKIFYKLKIRQNLNYIKKNQKEVKKRLRQKKCYNVAFYVYDEAKWKSQSLYDLMAKSDRFNPVIIVTKNCAPEGNPNYQTIKDVKRCYEFFKTKGMNVKLGYNIENEKFVPFEELTPVPDLIIYSHPWYVYKTQGPVICSKFALTFYIPYFIVVAGKWFEYNLRFHQYLYKHYVPTESVKNSYSQKMDNKGKNLCAVGHPLLDYYYLNPEEKEKKYIIYAPHWTVAGDNIRFGTFDWNGYEILKFAESHPEYQWIFRPHPLFYNSILSLNYMSKEQIDEYYKSWEKIGNISSGGDYLDLFKRSKCLITDCGSFLNEYFVSGNPLIHLVSEKFEGIEMIKKIDEMSYTAYNINELYHHLEEIVINSNDYKKEKRMELLDSMKLKNNYCAKRIIDNILEDLQ